MKRGWGMRPIRLRSIESSWGYTIVESLIFLAVSGAMAMAVMMLIAGQQGRAEFQSAVREFEVLLQDISNDIETGYSSASGTNCSFIGSNVQAAPPGPNNRCVFVGKVLQFGVGAGNDTQLAIHTVVGKQRVSPNEEATTLDEADARVLPGSTELKALRSMKIVSVRALGVSYGAFGYLTTFRDYQLGGDQLQSGSIGMDVIPIRDANGVLIGDSLTNVQNEIRDNWSAPVTNPSSGVAICLESLGSQQRALIVIGGSSGKNAAPTTLIGGTTQCN